MAMQRRSLSRTDVVGARGTPYSRFHRGPSTRSGALSMPCSHGSTHVVELKRVCCRGRPVGQLWLEICNQQWAQPAVLQA